MKKSDALTRAHTQFNSFSDLIGAKGGYEPRFILTFGDAARKAEVEELIETYNIIQMAHGDSRRASVVHK